MTNLKPNDFNFLIDEFDKWFKNDEHSKNMIIYDNVINKDYLSALNKKEFIDFMINFVEVGGKVQSGGSRNINEFKETIINNYDNFRKFILEPFQDNFSLKSWFKQIDNFNSFGEGIATIYLNRIDRNKYPIMNNKSIQALKKLGFKLNKTKTWKNYQLIQVYQQKLITDYPPLENFYKIDALNHFVIAVPKGVALIDNIFLKYEILDNEEQSEIQVKLHKGKKSVKINIYQSITELQKNDNSKLIEIKGTQYKRNNYLMALIKEYRGYSCQFCQTKIPKSDGSYYIEACHIKAKADGGNDTLENILILCPNCHKLYDYNKRENEEIKNNIYSVTLQGTKYQAKLD